MTPAHILFWVDNAKKGLLLGYWRLAQLVGLAHGGKHFPRNAEDIPGWPPKVIENDEQAAEHVMLQVHAAFGGGPIEYVKKEDW